MNIGGYGRQWHDDFSTGVRGPQLVCRREIAPRLLLSFGHVWIYQPYLVVVNKADLVRDPMYDFNTTVSLRRPHQFPATCSSLPLKDHDRFAEKTDKHLADPSPHCHQVTSEKSTESYVPELAAVSWSYQRNEVQLSDGYRPHPFDVICRNDRERVFHSGNDYFLQQLHQRIDQYANASSRSARSLVIRDIIRAVRIRGGRFIRQHQKRRKQVAAAPGLSQSRGVDHNNDDEEDVSEGGHEVHYVYFDIGLRKASDKAGHAMRLALSKHI